MRSFLLSFVLSLCISGAAKAYEDDYFDIPREVLDLIAQDCFYYGDACEAVNFVPKTATHDAQSRFMILLNGAWICTRRACKAGFLTGAANNTLLLTPATMAEDEDYTIPRGALDLIYQECFHNEERCEAINVVPENITNDGQPDFVIFSTGDPSIQVCPRNGCSTNFVLSMDEAYIFGLESSFLSSSPSRPNPLIWQQGEGATPAPFVVKGDSRGCSALWEWNGETYKFKDCTPEDKKKIDQFYGTARQAKDEYYTIPRAAFDLILRACDQIACESIQLRQHNITDDGEPDFEAYFEGPNPICFTIGCPVSAFFSLNGTYVQDLFIHSFHGKLNWQEGEGETPAPFIESLIKLGGQCSILYKWNGEEYAYADCIFED